MIACEPCHEGDHEDCRLTFCECVCPDDSDYEADELGDD